MTDIDKFRHEQEARQAAQLKAKLDMVVAVKRGSYDQSEYREYAHGRLPRKVGEINSRSGVKHQYGGDAQRVSFPLRLDTHKGVFIAEHGDMLYVSPSKEALQAKMDEVAQVRLDLRWQRWLVVDYTAFSPDDTFHSSVELDKKRTKNQRITGIKLQWKVVEYSNEFSLPGSTGEHMKRYMTRAVVNGKVEKDERVVTELPKLGMVPYTPEREALLRKVQDALKAIDGKLVELLRGKPEDVAARLDGMTLPQLMSGGDS